MGKGKTERMRRRLRNRFSALPVYWWIGCGAQEKEKLRMIPCFCLEILTSANVCTCRKHWGKGHLGTLNNAWNTESTVTLRKHYLKRASALKLLFWLVFVGNQEHDSQIHRLLGQERQMVVVPQAQHSRKGLSFIFMNMIYIVLACQYFFQIVNLLLLCVGAFSSGSSEGS